MAPALKKQMIVLSAVLVFITAIPFLADAFFFRGNIDSNFNYKKLKIYRKEVRHTPTNRDRYYGYNAPVYGYEYYLQGYIENTSNTTFTDVTITFYAKDCVGGPIHWNVTADIGTIKPWEPTPFNAFISETEPIKPCKFDFQVYIKEPEPEQKKENDEPVDPVHETEKDEEETTEVADTEDISDEPIVEWTDEDGVKHYSNKPKKKNKP
jgi:hypothetical protein